MGKKKNHYLEVIINEIPKDDPYAYTGKGFIWFYCSCGHRIKISISEARVIVGVREYEYTV